MSDQEQPAGSRSDAPEAAISEAASQSSSSALVLAAVVVIYALAHGLNNAIGILRLYSE